MKLPHIWDFERRISFENETIMPTGRYRCAACGVRQSQANLDAHCETHLAMVLAEPDLGSDEDDDGR